MTSVLWLSHTGISSSCSWGSGTRRAEALEKAENSRGEPRDQSPAENVWGLAGSTGNFNQMGWRKRGGTGSHQCHDEQQMGKEAIPVGWPWPSRLDIDYGHGRAGRNVDDKWTRAEVMRPLILHQITEPGRRNRLVPYRNWRGKRERRLASRMGSSLCPWLSGLLLPPNHSSGLLSAFVCPRWSLFTTPDCCPPCSQWSLSCSSPLHHVGPTIWTHFPLRSGHLWLGQNLQCLLVLVLTCIVLRLLCVLTAEPNLPLATAAETIADLLRDAPKETKSAYARVLAQNVPKLTSVDVLPIDRSKLFQPDSPLLCLLITQGAVLRDLCRDYPQIRSFLETVRLAINDESQQGGQAGFTILATCLSRLCLQIFTGDREQTRASTGGDLLKEALTRRLAVKSIGLLGTQHPRLPTEMVQFNPLRKRSRFLSQLGICLVQGDLLI